MYGVCYTVLYSIASTPTYDTIPPGRVVVVVVEDLDLVVVVVVVVVVSSSSSFSWFPFIGVVVTRR